MLIQALVHLIIRMGHTDLLLDGIQLLRSITAGKPFLRIQVLPYEEGIGAGKIGPDLKEDQKIH